MSTSTDSGDYQSRIQSNKLLPLFEEMQAIGFPISLLEQNISRLKKGAPNVCFTIYTYIYRTFRRCFDDHGIYLDPFILNDQVIDREGFLKKFFLGLEEIVRLEPALPLYQYICPGHPLAKVTEMADISGRLRAHRSGKEQVVDGSNEANLRRLSRTVERLAGTKVDGSFSSNKSLYGSTGEQSLNPGVKIAPPTIPWRAVRERAPVSDTDDSSDDEQSVDEGIRSWNASTVNRAPVDARTLHPQHPVAGKSQQRQDSVKITMEQREMDSQAGIRSVLEKFEQIESLQNLKFRSIEERLIRIEHDLVDNNAALDRNVTQRLDNHEVRIENLEHGVVRQYSGQLMRSNESVQKKVSSVESQHRDRSNSRGSRSSEKAPHVEPRHSLTTHSRAMSVSRSFAGEKERDLLRDSGFSSTHAVHSAVATGDVDHQRALHGQAIDHAMESDHARPDSAHFSKYSTRDTESHRIDHSRTATAEVAAASTSHQDVSQAAKFSTYFDQGDRLLEQEQPETRGRTASRSYEQLYRGRRHKSVGPGEISRQRLSVIADLNVKDDNALVDLNERIQLRLRERIRTAEETLNACMETIRKDYILLRRHH